MFAFAERLLLLLIGALAIVAVIFELIGLRDSGGINLADLLLLFIYLEVLGMAYAYYSTHSVPVTLPVLIAITGITRLILLSKDSEPNQLLYEAGAVLSRCRLRHSELGREQIPKWYRLFKQSEKLRLFIPELSYDGA